MKKEPIIIYRDKLLPHSETFIINQGENLKAFEGVYVGSRSVAGLNLPTNRTCVINNGNKIIGTVKELIFKLGFFTDIPKLTQFKPRLIHAHFGVDGAIALTLKKKHKIPLLVTFHGYDITVKDEFLKDSFSYKIYLKRREELKKEIDVAIAVSNFIKSKLLEQGFPEEKIIQHYIGIDTDYFSPVNKERKKQVLFVGRLVEKKGCKYLIRAMKIVQSVLPDVELLIVGDGPERKNLNKLAESLNVKHKFLGVQSQEQIRTLMNDSMIFSVPSIKSPEGDEEGLGMVFLEAQSMGLPVVSFHSGGIPEAVTHGETGYLTTEKDWESLSEYIIELISNQVIWEKFSRNGKKSIREKFDILEQTAKLEKIYNDVLGQGNGN